MAYVTYKNYGICWMPLAYCYWVYDRNTKKTVFYSNESVEKIKNRLDKI